MIIGIIIGVIVGYMLASIMAAGKISDLCADNMMLVEEIKRLRGERNGKET